MKNKEKNGFSRLLLPEILTVLIGGAAVYGLGLLGKQLSVENALRDAVMAALGLAVSGFFLRREVVDSRLDYDNGEHLMRFWTAVWCSLLFSLACAFLPAGGWPFLAVFVVLSLFSNLSVGIVFSGVFLMIATLWGQSVGIFFLYFISGVFAACLFQHLEQEFAIGIPLFLSLFCLLLLQKEPEKKPDYEQVIDRIFERIREKGIFSECDLSLRGWNRMQKIFKEEKLYYDILR